jgi:uncharacterized protein
MSIHSSGRIDVADSLRGFAILGILLVHSVEHYNFFSFPPNDNQLLALFNTIFNNSIFFIFAGKAYAIFALLFGFSFFIQDDNQLKRGYDFRLRFLWRLVVLAGWGLINCMFYTGDVLVIFAIFGPLLAATARLSNKVVLGIAILLLSQPMEWLCLIYATFKPDFTLGEKMYGIYYSQTIPVLANGNLLETMVMGIKSGFLYCFLWWVEEGRIFQLGALFLFGMLIGRRRLFLEEPKNIKFWRYALIIGIVSYFPLNGLHAVLPRFIENKAIVHLLDTILSCYTNFAFLCFLVSLFVLSYYKTNLHKWQAKLAPYGRMSLSMYLSQSILGGFVFYNWGLGLSSVLSITASVGVALVIFGLQYTFACWWLKSHKQGPLEYIWKKLTWIGNS